MIDINFKEFFFQIKFLLTTEYKVAYSEKQSSAYRNIFPDILLQMKKITKYFRLRKYKSKGFFSRLFEIDSYECELPLNMLLNNAEQFFLCFLFFIG